MPSARTRAGLNLNTAWLTVISSRNHGIDPCTKEGMKPRYEEAVAVGGSPSLTERLR